MDNDVSSSAMEDRRRNSRTPVNLPGEDIVEPVTSSNRLENDNILVERNSNNSNLNSSSGRCLEPVARMILPRQMEVNPFSRPRDFDALKSEEARLDSFSQPPGWPIPFIRPEDCARSGFFFLQEDDKVQCAFCRGVAGEWEQGDDPLMEHRRHFPLCPFILGLPVGNIALHQEEGAESTSHDEAAGVDVCGHFSPDLSQMTLASDQPASVRGAQPLGGNGNEVVTSLGIKTCGNGPSHSSLVTVHSRIKTFTNWPRNSGLTPETMAEAGFFYIGRKDHVKCFYCDGGLRNWEASDDPWLEHARWFSSCTYVILNKGDSFVKEITESKPPILPQPVGLELAKSVAASSSSSSDNSSDSDEEDDDVTSSSSGNKSSRPKQAATRTSSGGSGDSGLSSISTECCSSSTSSGNSSGDESSEGSTESTGCAEPESDLKEEVRKLREQTICKICMDNQVGIVFLPCGHLVSCTRCATALSNCAFCRQPIKAVVRTYLS